MKRTFTGACFTLLVGILHAQTPNITAVNGENTGSGLCPGGVAFVQGTNLGGTSTVVTVGTKHAYVFNALGNGTTLQIELPVDAPVGATTLTAGSSAPANITLKQYCPALPSNNNVAYAFHYPSQTPVTSSFPATPNEQIALLATGLGPATPVYATGTAPSDNSAAVSTLPTASVAGKAVAVSSAFLAPNSPGFYEIVFTMRSDATTGNQPVNITLGGITSGSPVLPVTVGPVVGGVTSAASYIDPKLPNGAVAQGSIAIISGINLGPGQISIDSTTPFQKTTLSGTSVAITVNGTTTAGLMYYTSASQLAFVIPSNTPAGTGTVTVSYNGQAGPAAPIRVAAGNPGIFTVTSDGQGAGILTYPDYSLVSATKVGNCGGPYTYCGAANPGDVLTVWATGLGPVNGSDAAGAGLGVNMTSVPTTIWLGNQQISPAYAGRSGCCIGEDQIVFTVPANAPTGCNVPLTIQIGNFVSNSVSVAVAPAGTRTCAGTDPVFTPSAISKLSNLGTETFSYAEFDLKHQDQDPGYIDKLAGTLIRFTIPASAQPFFVSDSDYPAFGTCQIFNTLNGSNPPLTPVAGLDSGAQITVQGPNGSTSAGVNGGTSSAVVSSTGAYLVPGTYTISAPGGKDIPAFTASITIPTMPTMTSPTPDAAAPITVTRSNGLTVTWTGGQPNGYVQLEIYNATDNTFTTGADIQCSAPAAAGTFTIPANVLMALPAGGFGGLTFRPYANPTAISVTGLDLALINAWSTSDASITVK